MPIAIKAQTPHGDAHTLVLPVAIYNGIIIHAREGKPEEICGLIRGHNNKATEMVRAKNIAQNPVLDYEVAPEALLNVFDWEQAGDELIAIYHSHPTSPAYPSATDAHKAYYPDTVFLICSLLAETEPQLRGFFLREMPGEIDLKTVQKEIAFEQVRPGRWATYVPHDQPVPVSLAHLDRQGEQALYVVFQQKQSSHVAVRVVAVQNVDVLIE